MKPASRCIALALLALLMACVPNVIRVDCAEEPEACANMTQSVGPRLYVDPPFGLTFSCVLLGCEELRTLRVENRGDGVLAIPLVRLALDAPPEFALHFESEQEDKTENASPQAVDPPDPSHQIHLRPGDALLVHVIYVASATGGGGTSVRIDSYDAKQDYRTASINRTDMPLEVRQLGKARSNLKSQTLSFGYVEPGASLTKYVEIDNTSTTDAILGITDTAITSQSSPEFFLGLGWSAHANPGDSVKIPITFSPNSNDVFFAELMVYSNDPGVNHYQVHLLGTSLVGPAATVLVPEGGNFSFGNVDLGELYNTQVRIRNDGADPLPLLLSLVGDEGFSLVGAAALTVDPLEHVDVPVELLVQQGGPLHAVLTVHHSDGALLGQVDFTAYGVAPLANASPTGVNFGTLVQGWSSQNRAVTVSNTGTGTLVISAIEFEVGTSNQFVLEGSQTLPAMVPEGLAQNVWVRAQASYLGAASGALLIHTNSVSNSVVRVPLVVNVQSCKNGCPIANGTPQCGGGVCAIASCHSGYHNTDGNIGTGCECMAERSGNDIGSTCTTGLNVGTLGDKCTNYPAEAVRTGNLHDKNDIDLYYFKTIDSNGAFCDVFSDSSRTSVRLESAPPGLALCVQIRDSGSGCGGYTHYYDPNICHSNYYEHDGKLGVNDSRDVTVWVLWKPDAAPVCDNYVLKFRGRN